MDISGVCKLIPMPGQYVVTCGKRGWGSAYMITACREVKRRRTTLGRRFSLSVSAAMRLKRRYGLNPGCWLMTCLYCNLLLKWADCRVVVIRGFKCVACADLEACGQRVADAERRRMGGQ
jgi:hypothetical protein